jgi:tetratricopeptide (TPR) repeat protein
MGNYFAHPDFLSQMFHIRGVSDALPLIYDQELMFETPGEQYAYSNSGIVLLGAIIERVSGQNYRQYIQDNILTPLNMNDTDINYLNEIEENRASGYMKSPSGVFTSNIFMVPPANADGGIESTVEDLLKLDQALYGNELLSVESREKMFTPFKEKYGYCWRIDEKHGNRVTWHSGGAPGVSANFKRFINDRYTFIVLSNYSGGSSKVSKTIEAIIFGDEYELPKPTLGEFLYQSMIEKGIANTMEDIDQLLSDNGYKIVSSRQLNFLGYTLLREEKLDMSLAIFQLNVQLFPEEANPYDSLGDAYLEKGNTELAIESFKKALRIDPSFESSKRKLEEFKLE